MGDIAQTEARDVRVTAAVQAHAPIERIDVLVRDRLARTFRPYSRNDLGERIRVVWEGAEYRGRGRQTRWQGRLRTIGPRIERMNAINSWNRERPTVQTDAHTVEFDAVTTGNFGGVDLWLEEPGAGRLVIEAGLVEADIALSEIGLEDIRLEAGGLERRIRVFGLPRTLEQCDVSCEVTVPLFTDGRDTPIWIRVTTEDGHSIWTSPVYLLPASRRATRSGEADRSG